MKEDKTSILISYLKHQLSQEERYNLEKELEHSPAMKQELEELSILLEQLEHPEEQEPSHYLRSRFYQYLDEEKAELGFSEKEVKGKEPRINVLKWSIAATILIIILFDMIWLWQQNQVQQEQISTLVQEVKAMHKTILVSKLEKTSASDRILALNKIQRVPADSALINVLVNTLNTDPNANVRMKAAEALVNFKRTPAVVDALVESLRYQDRPEVQITLIDILVRIKAPRAAQELQDFLEKKNLIEVVKNQAKQGLEILL